MKIGSININGVNAFGNTRKPGAWEFFEWYAPDILLLQETKGNLAKVKSAIGPMLDAYGYKPFVSESKGKAGYAGVALCIKKSFLESHQSTCVVKPTPWFDGGDFRVTAVELYDYLPDSVDEATRNAFKYYGTGRIIMYEDIEDNVIVGVYTLNSGGKDELRKLWDKLFLQFIQKLVSSNKNVYILGDLNVCHTSLDMWDWNNQLNCYPGLMQYEIDGFTKLLADCNLKDTFRHFHPELRRYSWSAPKVPLSKGWRLDYALTNKIETVVESTIQHEVRCSDHTYIELIIK